MTTRIYLEPARSTGPGGALQGTDVLPVEANNANHDTYKATVTEVVDYVDANAQLEGTDQVTGLDAALASKLPLSGGIMSGNIDMSGFGIKNIIDPISAQDAATKIYVDTQATSDGALKFNVLNVKPGGSDVGATGSPIKPFGTVTAAYAAGVALSAPFVVLCAPGTHTFGSLALVPNGFIEGCGKGTTILNCTGNFTAAASWSSAASLPRKKSGISNCTLDFTNGTSLEIDPALYPYANLYFINVETLGGAVAFLIQGFADAVYFQNCAFDNVHIVGCTLYSRDSYYSGNFLLSTRNPDTLADIGSCYLESYSDYFFSALLVKSFISFSAEAFLFSPYFANSNPQLTGNNTTITIDPITPTPTIDAGSPTINYHGIADNVVAGFSPTAYSAANTRIKSHLQGINAALLGTIFIENTTVVSLPGKLPGSFIRTFNNSATSIEVPLDSTENFPEGTIFGFQQHGNGLATFVPETGAVVIDILGAQTPTSIGVGSIFFIKKVSPDHWVVWGDLQGAKVLGPASSTDKAIVRFNGTNGSSIQNSPVTIDDDGNMNGIEDINVDRISYLKNGGFNPSSYNTGTVTIADGQVTGSGTTFTAAMVGGLFVITSGPSAGVSSVIFNYASATSIGLFDGTINVAAGTSYIIKYGGLSVDGSMIGINNDLTIRGAPAWEDPQTFPGASFSDDVDMGSNLISNTADPVSGQDVATKNYVDNAFGFSTLALNGCSLASRPGENLNATYSNGSSGVGATLTNAGTQAVFSLDNGSPPVGYRVLVWQQTNAAHNGIYVVTDVGSGSTNWVLTRATDFDSASKIVRGCYTAINSGSINQGRVFGVDIPSPIVVGTNDITFSFNSYSNVDSSSSTSITLQLQHFQRYFRTTAATAVTITVDTNANVPFLIGTEITIIQAGAGQVTFAAAGGVTINSKLGNLKIAAQYSAATLKKVGTNTWDLIGDLVA